MIEYSGRVQRDALVGDDWVPVIPVVLKNGDAEIMTIAVVDSGAHISLIPFTLGSALGLEIDNDEPITGEQSAAPRYPIDFGTFS